MRSENPSKPNKSGPVNKHKKLLKYTAIATIAMFGFAYALVPMFNLLCKVAGVNGKTDNFAVELKPNEKPDLTRNITVMFLATNNAQIPWDFHPDIRKVVVHPGEKAHLAYYAKNNSGHRMTVQAIPSVAPGEAAKHLHKTECFCFKQQTFNKGEGRDMPLVFHLDKDLPKDITSITLSYTLFDATPFAPKEKAKAESVS